MAGVVVVGGCRGVVLVACTETGEWRAGDREGDDRLGGEARLLPLTANEEDEDDEEDK